jgi:nicotinamidase-related amidase
MFDRREKGIMIFNIMTIHNEDKSTWDMVIKRHNFQVLLRGNTDSKLVEGFEFLEEYQQIEKTRHSAFSRTDLEAELRKNDIDTVILCGVFIDGCIGRTAIDAYEYDFEVIIAEKASLGLEKDKSEMMLGIIKDEFEQRVLSNQEIFQLLCNCPDRSCTPSALRFERAGAALRAGSEEGKASRWAMKPERFCWYCVYSIQDETRKSCITTEIPCPHT